MGMTLIAWVTAEENLFSTSADALGGFYHDGTYKDGMYSISTSPFLRFDE